MILYHINWEREGKSVKYKMKNIRIKKLCLTWFLGCEFYYITKLIAISNFGKGRYTDRIGGDGFQSNKFGFSLKTWNILKSRKKFLGTMNHQKFVSGRKFYYIKAMSLCLTYDLASMGIFN